MNAKKWMSDNKLRKVQIQKVRDYNWCHYTFYNTPEILESLLENSGLTNVLGLVASDIRQREIAEEIISKM